jgi:hypothetical protein
MLESMFLALLKESIGTSEIALRTRVALSSLTLRDSWLETELLITSTITQIELLRCPTGSVSSQLLHTTDGWLTIALSLLILLAQPATNLLGNGKQL